VSSPSPSSTTKPHSFGFQHSLASLLFSLVSVLGYLSSKSTAVPAALVKQQTTRYSYRFSYQHRPHSSSSPSVQLPILMELTLRPYSPLQRYQKKLDDSTSALLGTWSNYHMGKRPLGPSLIKPTDRMDSPTSFKVFIFPSILFILSTIFPI
jgi:hypothetical protein